MEPPSNYSYKNLGRMFPSQDVYHPRQAESCRDIHRPRQEHTEQSYSEEPHSLQAMGECAIRE